MGLIYYSMHLGCAEWMRMWQAFVSFVAVHGIARTLDKFVIFVVIIYLQKLNSLLFVAVHGITRTLDKFVIFVVIIYPAKVEFSYLW